VQFNWPCWYISYKLF